MQDVEEMSSDSDLDEPFVTYAYQLQDLLAKTFKNQISFYKEGVTCKIIVHCIDVNPCTYALAAMRGAGLKDDDLTKAFARLVRRKLKGSEAVSWPVTPEELLERLDSAGPLVHIYNAIAWTVNPRATRNEFGYAKAGSASLSEKIWAIASDWQSIVTHEHSSKSTALSLVVHWLTGSKEVASLLHKCGHGISYKDVLSLSNSWAQSVRKTLPATIAPGKPFHVTLDNSDGRQQTLTGAETTHHMNGTVFQISNRESEQSVSSSTTTTEEKLCMKDEDNLEYGTYKIPKRVNPPAVPEFQDKSQSDLFEWCLARDIAWVTTGALGTAFKTEKDTETPDYMYTGSWTTFMKSVTDFWHTKSMFRIP